MDPGRFASSSSGKVIKVGKGDIAYWSFVPDPLPAELPLNADLFRALSEADRALGELAGLARNLSNPHLLINPFIKKEAVLSSKIEGTQATMLDLFAYEAGQLPLPGVSNTSESDVREVGNYVKALEFGITRLKKLPLSLRLIREVHKQLLTGVRGGHASPGEFRETPNWIGGRNLNDVIYVPPPTDEMRAALHELETYLHQEDSLPPLVRLALIHAQFERIHPFIDGNGRVGRLLITLTLLSWNLLPLPLLYLSAYFERRREEYCNLLQSISETGNWLGWTIFFLNGIAEQSHDAIARSKRLLDLQLDWRQKMTRSRSSAMVLQLVDAFFETPYMTVASVRMALKIKAGVDISYQGAQKIVRKMEDAGLVNRRQRRGYAMYFVAEPIVHIISEK
jgi:Fic family protein